MGINRKIRNFLISSFLFFNLSFISLASDYGVVDTTSQIYSYDSMVEDIISLGLGHEEIMSYESLGTTSEGRSVWLVKFGNLNADNKIMITASIHAREYMTSQLVMKMLEEYVLNFDTTLPDGTTYRQVFDSVCLYILPMVNPDGVSISQFGANGANNQDTINWLNTLSSQGENLTIIKANANGVDLNRNFPIGFGLGNPSSAAPGLCFYPGTSPLSEVETLAIANLLGHNQFVCGINYHSMGNIIYYGANTNTKEVDAACRNMAIYANSINGYSIKYCGNALGSLADYFGNVENAPSITIEIGTKNPVPISQFNTIYNKNFAVWAKVAQLY